MKYTINTNNHGCIIRDERQISPLFIHNVLTNNVTIRGGFVVNKNFQTDAELGKEWVDDNQL